MAQNNVGGNLVHECVLLVCETAFLRAAGLAEWYLERVSRAVPTRWYRRVPGAAERPKTDFVRGISAEPRV